MVKRMRRILVLVFVFAFIPFSFCYAAGYFALTVDNNAGGRALPAACTGKTFVIMVLETANIRFTYEGTAPTSTTGTLLQLGQSLTLSGSGKISAFRAIRTGDVSGVLQGICE